MGWWEMSADADETIRLLKLFRDHCAAVARANAYEPSYWIRSIDPAEWLASLEPAAPVIPFENRPTVYVNQIWEGYLDYIVSDEGWRNQRAVVHVLSSSAPVRWTNGGVELEIAFSDCRRRAHLATVRSIVGEMVEFSYDNLEPVQP
jgi:hypothetical protein